MYRTLSRAANALRVTARCAIGAATAFTCAAGAAATAVPTGCVFIDADVARCTLADLFRPGAAVTVDSVQFRNWQFIDSDDALANLGAEAVDVTFSENGRRINLDFASDGFHSDQDGIEGNYLFSYDMFALGPQTNNVDKADLVLLDYDVGEGPSIARVSALEMVVFAQVFGEPEEQIFQSTDFSPSLRSITVETKISVSGSRIDGEPPGYGEVGLFRESFYRVPEPGTIALLSLAAMILASTRRFAAGTDHF